MWLKQLKIAIIEKNTNKLNELMDSLPQLENTEEIEEALYLIKEASELVYTLKDETSVSMRQMKKNIDFLNSTQTSTQKNTLDITS